MIKDTNQDQPNKETLRERSGKVQAWSFMSSGHVTLPAYVCVMNQETPLSHSDQSFYEFHSIDMIDGLTGNRLRLQDTLPREVGKSDWCQSWKSRV